MATRRGASISQKMILTSTILILVLVSLSGVISALNTRRIFDDAAAQLAEIHTTALKRRGEVQMLTMVETVRTALMQNDYSTLKTFVPAAANNDKTVVAIYVVADTGIVVAHSDSRLSERPVAEVDPVLGPEMVDIVRPDTRIIPPPKVPDRTLEPEGSPPERRFVSASPVMALGKKQGTLVVIYSLHDLDAAVARIESDRVAAGRANISRTVVLGLIFVLLGTAVAVFQAVRITRPIKQLSLRADQIARGDLDTRVEISSQDEIGLLAENFNYMADRLQVLLQETAAKATLEKELEVARAIQETLVPSADLIDRSIVRLAGYFQPATQCGGDWWTVHDLPDNKLLVVIGDVTGHGVPSAMITAAAKAACDVVRALEGPTLTPGRLLSTMNRAIYESAKRKFVMTCFVSIIDMTRRSISYSNAGHNFPYLYRAPQTLRPGESEFTVLMSRGNRLGDLQESSFTETEAVLRPGDVLVFYTDGIVECENAQGEEYGEKRFRGSIRNASNQEPAQLRDSVVAAAASFFGDRPRKDDITLVVARIR
jgi:serine phosphatase RsbU (regulator of sigma subunit)